MSSSSAVFRDNAALMDEFIDRTLKTREETHETTSQLTMRGCS